MRLIASLVLLASLLAAGEVAPPVRLANDAPYLERVAAIRAERPDPTDHQAHYAWLWRLSGAQFDARLYADAETTARAILALAPQVDEAHANLSVVLGKQGRYAEALQSAEIAALLDPREAMHADAIAASWLWHLGREAEAKARFAAILQPLDPARLRFYQACRACFLASVGDRPGLESAIRACLAGGTDHADFFARDVIFDAYRAEPWFVALVGPTLAEPAR